MVRKNLNLINKMKIFLIKTIGGCNAISCTRCGMTWCWICEMEFRTDCIQSHWF